jgi:TonB family protein
MARAVLLTLVFAVSFGRCSFAAQPAEFDESQLVGGQIPKAYRPDYPREARARRETGGGVFILHIDSNTGAVASITVQKSTGYRLLDAAALTSCIHWRFKPHTITEVRLPMTFSLQGGFIPQEWGPHGARD